MIWLKARAFKKSCTCLMSYTPVARTISVSNSIAISSHEENGRITFYCLTKLIYMTRTPISEVRWNQINRLWYFMVLFMRVWLTKFKALNTQPCLAEVPKVWTKYNVSFYMKVCCLASAEEFFHGWNIRCTSLLPLCDIALLHVVLYSANLCYLISILSI